MEKPFDLLIKNGRVIDGAGNPFYRADIGIKDGLISSIDRIIDNDLSIRVIDAEQRIVCPGFIDVHTHDDLYLLHDPSCRQKTSQGVTTVVIGNCGVSTGPFSNQYRGEMMSILNAGGADRLNEDDLSFNTFNEWLSYLEKKPLGVNVLSLVGHSTIRIAVMGFENRPPTAAELDRMQALVAEAMEAGAIGLSSGLIYAPGSYAKTDEIIALAKTVSEYFGIYATHLRNEGDHLITSMTEAIEIGSGGNIPVHISHLKALGKQNWGASNAALQLIAEAEIKGVTVSCDQYPYRAASTFLASTLPPAYLSDPDQLFGKKLQDPEFRKEIIHAIENQDNTGWENFIVGAGFDGIVISVAKKHPHYMGRSVADIAESEQRSPYDVIFDLLSIEKFEAVALYFVNGTDDIINILQSKYTMIGSDGLPAFGDEKIHPRQTGTFPRILGSYVREKQLLSLESAIRKMTSLPAQTFGIKSKGLIKEGLDADLVIFDPETIEEQGTYDNPVRVPSGISQVLVNGQVVIESGQITGAASGKVLRFGVND